MQRNYLWLLVVIMLCIGSLNVQGQDTNDCAPNFKAQLGTHIANTIRLTVQESGIFPHYVNVKIEKGTVTIIQQADIGSSSNFFVEEIKKSLKTFRWKEEQTCNLDGEMSLIITISTVNYGVEVKSCPNLYKN